MQNRYMKKILCMTVVFCAAALTGCGTKTVKDSDTVMEIAGQRVVKAEYQMVLGDYESEIKRQYDTDTANRKDFWTSGEAGERPLDKIMQLAGEELAQKKTVAGLAADLGIEVQADYLTLAAQMERENDRRGGADETRAPVYGVDAFQMREYYDYIYTQLEYEVIESLKESEEVSQEELEKMYQQNREAYTSDVSVKMLVAEAMAGAGNAQLLQAAEDMEAHTDLAYFTESYPLVSFYELTMSSLNMQEGKSGAYMQRWLTASAMQPGEVCEPFAIGQNLMVMRCLERSEQAVQPFEEVEGLLKDDVLSGRAYEEIESRQKEVEITLALTQEQLENIALEALQMSNK